MRHSPISVLTPPIQVGLIGTGYAAQKRCLTLSDHPQAQIVAIAGSSLERCAALNSDPQSQHYDQWQALLQYRPLDLVIIATKNHLHAAIARAALNAGLHVVCEYPLALDATEAQELIQLAQVNQRLLHVEHIELLGNLHQTVRQNLPQIGTPIYARYTTLSPKQPVTERWNYHPAQFGFPFIAALSRFNRFTDLFGAVAQVNCQSQFWAQANPDYYRACLCSAQLQFQQGLIATITYGKGDTVAVAERSLVIHGDRGTLSFEGNQGELLQGEQRTPLKLGSRRGVFAQDTQQAIAHLTTGTPLYTTAAASAYTLKVAQAAETSAQTGKAIFL